MKFSGEVCCCILGNEFVTFKLLTSSLYLQQTNTENNNLQVILFQLLP